MKEQILKLRQEGKSYKEIQEIIGCSKSTISYHCNIQSKINSNKRARNYRKQGRCLTSILSQKRSGITDNRENKRISRARLRNHVPKPISYKRHEIKRKNNISWKSKDLLAKIGDNPVCYLTGDSIDLNNGYSYHLDHVVSRYDGGTDELENINIATREANLAKSNLSLDDFLKLCKKVLIHNGYNVE